MNEEQIREARIALGIVPMSDADYAWCNDVDALALFEAVEANDMPSMAHLIPILRARHGIEMLEKWFDVYKVR